MDAVQPAQDTLRAEPPGLRLDGATDGVTDGVAGTGPADAGKGGMVEADTGTSAVAGVPQVQVDGSPEPGPTPASPAVDNRRKRPAKRAEPPAGVAPDEPPTAAPAVATPPARTRAAAPPAAPPPAAAPPAAAPPAAAPRPAAVQETRRPGPAAHATSPAGAVPVLPPGADAEDAEDIRPAADLLSLARRVRNLVASLTLNLPVPEIERARRERELLLAQFDDYVLPRLRRMDAPLLAVIGGSTGAGKSTLTNSLARKEVSRSGVLRPTTRSPVLVHHPYDSGAFLTQRILPGLDRITSEALEPLHPVELDAPRITALRLVPHEGITAGLALLDAPDIDSVVEANRELAVQLLGAADLWLFVTTASRYSDAMPWEMLRTASDRGVSVAVILDRVPSDSMSVVRSDLARMLRDQGLGSSPMFTLPEMPLEEGMLPLEVVTPLLRWLHRLASDIRSRDMVVRRTLAGALDSLPARVHVLVSAADEQEAADHALRTELDAVFARSRSRLATQLADGTVLRGEVLGRWQRFVGSGDLVKQVERSAGRLTDRIAAAVRRPPVLRTEDVGEAIDTGMRAVISTGVLEMVEQALSRWQGHPGGDGVVPAGRDGSTQSELQVRVSRLVGSWQAALAMDVQDHADRRRIPAWGISLGTEGMGVLVTVAVFSQAARTHAEQTGQPADAAATATALAQRILEGMFGAEAIRPMLLRAHQTLLAQVDELCHAERARLQGVVDAIEVRPGSGATLRSAMQALEEAR